MAPADLSNASAPANLTGIVVDMGTGKDKGLNASITGFKGEWEYQFGRSLPVHSINASLPLGGLADLAAARSLLNGTLIWWNASMILANLSDSSLPAVNRSAKGQDTLLAPWRNDSATGWVMDAGCFDTMQRFTAYHAITLTRNENWTGIVFKEMRMNIQLDALGWSTGILSVEATFKVFVARQINCIEFPSSPLNEIANISLLGFNNGWSSTDIAERANYLAWLADVLQLAAQYHVRVFLASDELIMTHPMYDWLNEELGYAGPEYGAEETKQFPDSIYEQAIAPDSPVWTLLEAKYQAVIEALGTIMNSTNADGFGGFKFRIDDISLKNWQGQEVYKKVSFMHTVETLGRFINITTAAAADVNAEVIQRMWMIQETENPFNNATLCHQMLDPITATNLILRTKETYNDHWLNMPANPTMGVSHHRWIIGWAVQAITPYFRGFLHDWYSDNGTRYDYGNGTTVGWWDNPNIVGYDGMQLTAPSWRTLATPDATRDATVFYLVQHTYNASIRAGDGVRAYLNKVGIFDPAIVANITHVFDLSTEVFRQLFFMKAWSTSGKFRGDVVNNGNSITFDPTRFNMFYMTLPNYGGMPGVQYTLDEGYNGSSVAWEMADSCPASYPGYGSLDDSPDFVFNASSVDYANLTSVLGYFREHIRAYAAFADLFADWRAWHVAYFHWLYTWDAGCFQIAEQARNNIIAKHNAYQQKYTPYGWGFVYSYSQLEGAWMALVGRTDAARAGLLAILIGMALLGTAAVLSYSPKGLRAKEMVKVMLGTSKWRKEDRHELFVMPTTDRVKWLAGSIVFPAGMIAGWALMFQVLFAWQLPNLAMPFLVIIGGYITGSRVGAAITQAIGKKDWRSMHATGLAMVWQWVLLLVFLVVFVAGGSIAVILGFNSPGFYTLLGLVAGCSFLGIWSFMRNMVYKNKKHAIGAFFIIIICIVGCVLVFGLAAGGIDKVIADFLFQLDHLNA